VDGLTPGATIPYQLKRFPLPNLPSPLPFGLLRHRSLTLYVSTNVATERIDRRSYILMLLVVGLVGFGTIMVYSASAGLGQMQFDSGRFFLKRWVLRLAVSLVAMCLVMRVDYRMWSKLAKPLLLVGFIGLTAVLVLKLFGVGKIRGAYRWIQFPGGAFQPADLMRLALVMFLADALSRRQGLLTDFKKGFLPNALVVGLAMGMIVLQPDLGTALAIGLTCTMMLYLAGARLAHLAGACMALLPLVYLVVFVIGYRKERVLAFLNPADDTLGASYQVTQSLIALGSGGVTGRGLGESLQKHFFLPEPHTDFVYSIVGEELGLVGTAGLVLLFLVFARLGFQVGRRASDLHGFLVASGITCMVLVYALINMGVCTGLVPATGLPLPFISYGGSSLLLTMVAAGILISVGRHTPAASGATPRETEARQQRFFRHSQRRTT
jgi:cell division protein FtsW